MARPGARQCVGYRLLLRTFPPQLGEAGRGGAAGPPAATPPVTNADMGRRRRRKCFKLKFGQQQYAEQPGV